MKTLRRRLTGKARWESLWRCREPVVVIESDDWGLSRRPAAVALSEFGTPGPWADEATETQTDLHRLFAELERHRDAFGRPACLTANFIVANPDFEKIEADGWTRYHEVAIDTLPLCSEWNRGLILGVFIPQYHGRSHFDLESWMRDLEENVRGARYLARACHNGGLSLLKHHGWRYHSEYVGWNRTDPGPDRDLEAWIAGGLEIFQRAFGFSTTTTVPPHYLLDRRTEKLLAAAGIVAVQGCGYRILQDEHGQASIVSHSSGERLEAGLLALARTLKFEPRPGESRARVDVATRRALECFRSGVPVVIDTHRINYSGSNGDLAGYGVDALGALLESLAPHRPLFLTSSELAQAILGDGWFMDVKTGERRRLHPRNGSARRQIRGYFARRTATQIARMTD